MGLATAYITKSKTWQSSVESRSVETRPDDPCISVTVCSQGFRFPSQMLTKTYVNSMHDSEIEVRPARRVVQAGGGGDGPAVGALGLHGPYPGKAHGHINLIGLTAC